MKQKNAVVATKTIEALREYDLREFFTKSGSFVANASLTPVVSPQGERVTGRGDRVDLNIDLKQVAGIKCASCDSILVANKQVAHNHDVTNCIVCGAALEYPDDDEEEDLGGELTGDEDDLDDLDDLDSFDEEPVLDDDEDDLDDSDDSDYEDDLDDDEEDEDEEDDAIEYGDDEDDVQAAAFCSDASVPELVMIREDTIAAIVENTIVATLTADAPNFEAVRSENFDKGFIKTIEKMGMVEALESANFKLVTFPKEVIAKVKLEAKTKREAQEASVRETNARSRYGRCVDIAAAAASVGMFKKQGANVLHTELSNVLQAAGVDKPALTAKKVLASALPKFNDAVSKIAGELAEKDDDHLSSLEDQILDMDPTALDRVEEEIEVQKTSNDNSNETLSRLMTPARLPEVAATKTPAKASSLFNPKF